ncbi:MAG: NapC/NirT family cytochrome c [Gammaproteobacteria bacterium]|nr:NapC/NirT family cytochrome c [Gammaproteobacteria bacterium]
MKKSIIFTIFIFLLGMLAMGGVNTFFAFTNTNEFCTSCHSMQINKAEWEKTIHFKNPSGVQAGCADCHVPKQFFPKLYAKIYAAKDVYHEFIGTFAVDDEIKNNPEAYLAHYNKHRWTMANQVWAKMKANNSRECRNCHDYNSMDLDEQGRSAKKKHSRAPMEGKTCIDCHKGIAHEEPDEP